MLRRAQQQQRQVGVRGGELQPLARFQIEFVDDAGDGGGGARMQRFLQSPQGFVPVRRLDQNETCWIKAKRADAVTMRTAVIAQPVSREDENDRAGIDLLPTPQGGR